MDAEEVNEVVKILGSKKPSHSDIKFLFDKYRHIAFLKELLDQGKKSIVYDLLSCLRYQNANENDVIFLAGDRSSKFFLIIRGNVRILLSDPSVNPQPCPFPGLFDKNQNEKRLFPSRENRWTFKSVANLTDGQTFGELGILHDKPRLATVVAASPTVFGVINADDFKRILEPTMMAESEEKLKFLKPLMEYECSYEEYWRLAAYFSKVPLNRYHTLYEEGQPFDKVFFVASGMVRLEKLVGKVDYANVGKNEASTSRDQFRPTQSPNKGSRVRSTVNQRPLGKYEPDQQSGLRRKIFAKTNAQPLIVFGQNQFLGFKELLESHTLYCSSARVVEAGVAFSIEVDNIRRCFSEFTSFKRAFFQRTSAILDQMNVA